MTQVSQFEGETSTLTIFTKSGWINPSEEDYVYVRTETEYLLELLGYRYQSISSKEILIQKLSEEDIQNIQESFNALKKTFRWIAPWAAINIE